MSQPAVLQHLYTLFYGGDTGVKLVVARKLFLRYGWELERNSRLTRGLSELVRLHEGLKLQMLAMELDRICSRCAQKTDGGCCSQAMAAEIDVAQLLLNMLAGVPVSCTQNNGPSCCFLGDKGCIFLLKPVFCLNYICSKIVGKRQGPELLILEKQTGRLLQAQTGMEGVLIDFFAERGPALGCDV